MSSVITFKSSEIAILIGQEWPTWKLFHMVRYAWMVPKIGVLSGLGQNSNVEFEDFLQNKLGRPTVQ